MAQPLSVIVEDMLDHIEQAQSFVADMTFEQFRDDKKPSERSSSASK